jgi:hypothetical protein
MLLERVFLKIYFTRSRFLARMSSSFKQDTDDCLVEIRQLSLTTWLKLPHL